MDSAKLEATTKKFGPMPAHVTTAATGDDPATIIKDWCEYLLKVNEKDPKLAAELLNDPTNKPAERDRILPQVFTYLTKLPKDFDATAARLQPGQPFWSAVFAIGQLPQVRNSMHRANAMTALRSLVDPPIEERVTWARDHPGDAEKIYELEDKLLKAEPGVWRALSDLFGTLNETFRMPFSNVKNYLNDSVLYRLTMVWDGKGEENLSLTADDAKAVAFHINKFMNRGPVIHGFITKDQYEKYGFKLDAEGWIQRIAGTVPIILSEEERDEIHRVGTIKVNALFEEAGHE